MDFYDDEQNGGKRIEDFSIFDFELDDYAYMDEDEDSHAEADGIADLPTLPDLVEDEDEDKDKGEDEGKGDDKDKGEDEDKDKGGETIEGGENEKANNGANEFWKAQPIQFVSFKILYVERQEKNVQFQRKKLLRLTTTNIITDEEMVAMVEDARLGKQPSETDYVFHSLLVPQQDGTLRKHSILCPIEFPSEGVSLHLHPIVSELVLIMKERPPLYLREWAKRRERKNGRGTKCRRC